jgi:hypothetical protein
MFEMIRLKPFLAAFAIGVAFVYITKPEARIVIKFPSPHNAGKVVYRDDKNQCYMYRADKETCPVDTKKIKPQPVVETRELTVA